MFALPPRKKGPPHTKQQVFKRTNSDNKELLLIRNGLIFLLLFLKTLSINYAINVHDIKKIITLFKVAIMPSSDSAL